MREKSTTRVIFSRRSTTKVVDLLQMQAARWVGMASHGCLPVVALLLLLCSAQREAPLKRISVLSPAQGLSRTQDLLGGRLQERVSCPEFFERVEGHRR